MKTISKTLMLIWHMFILVLGVVIMFNVLMFILFIMVITTI